MATARTIVLRAMKHGLSVCLKVGVGAACATLAPTIVAAELEWKVVNRFPLLPTDVFLGVEQDWDSVSSHEMPMMRFIQMRMANKATARASGDSYAESRPLLVDPRILRETAPPSAVGVELTYRGAPSSCRWHLPANVAIESSSPVASPSTACTVRIRVPRDAQTPVLLALERAPQAIIASVVIDIRTVNIAVMGDSYVSGEGSPDMPSSGYNPVAPRGNSWFLQGSPAPAVAAVWWNETCHRSLLSWPVLAALRVALSTPHSVVTLTNQACSGAEVLDGLYLGQQKTTELGTRAAPRDGAGPRYIRGDDGALFIPRSQINALRDALCEPDLTGANEAMVRPGAQYEVAVRRCANPRPPDALLLGIGGNDVGFAAAVRGVMVPDTASGTGLLKAIRGVFLGVTRDFLKTIPLSRFASNVGQMSKEYSSLITEIANHALTPPNKTVLMKYPNPLDPPNDERSPKSGCSDPKVRERIKYSYLAFGPLARHVAGPLGSNIRWVFDLNPREVEEFTTRAFPALEKMQKTVEGADVRTFPFLGSSKPTPFDGRLVCTDGVEETLRLSALEPFYFCEGPSGTSLYDPDKCGVIHKNRHLGEWNYQAKGRRIINTVNDALLGQRSWTRTTPTDQQLSEAVAGAFHPVTEAHAVAADAAFKALCDAINTPRGTAIAPDPRHVCPALASP